MSPPYNLSSTDLFKPLKVGAHVLKNRVALAPSTRARATVEGMPTDLMVQYYYDRAVGSDGGLLVTEAAWISPQGSGWHRSPGIYSEEQAKAWRIITDKVHETETKISCQMWYMGRGAKPSEMKRWGLDLVAPSVIYGDEKMEQDIKDLGVKLTALTLEQIEEVKQDFVNALKLAIDVAGFDYIEIHSANGYLLDEFMHPCTNNRTDKYGGSVINRARLPLEIVDLVVDAVGLDKVAIRITPFGDWNNVKGYDEVDNPIYNFGYYAFELGKRNLAYLSVQESKYYLPETPKTFMSNEFLYQVFPNVILRAGCYHDHWDYVERDLIEDRTLIGFSRAFLANPDLPLRLKNDWELEEFDLKYLFNVTNDGYNTFPFHGQELKITDEERERVGVPLL